AADQLELLKAQLALDDDDLEDAQQDLARAGGDKRSQLQRAMQEHQALQHANSQAPKAKLAGRPTILAEQIQAWLALADRLHQLSAAGRQATETAAALERAHDQIEKPLRKETEAAAQAQAGQTRDRVARLRQLD